MRIVEYFDNSNIEVLKDSVGSIPSNLFHQERDWTCSIACIRTILSSVADSIISEKDIIDEYNLKPSPYYSIDIKNLGILNKYNAIFGCDLKEDYNINYLIELLYQGYYIMVESMINYDHWLVLLAYISLSDNYDSNLVILYDPYYNEIKNMRVSEFSAMWCSGEHESNNIDSDFIAVKKVI